MLRLLLALFYLAQLAQGTSTDMTDSECPTKSRTIWGILGSCALTLLICVWHTIHFDIPRTTYKWYTKPVVLVLASFLAPEAVVMVAHAQWWRARCKVNRFHEKGYHWSMTHSFFAEMGGFTYQDKQGGLTTIKSLEFLELCEANKIANPLVTVREIRDKSKSDALGKAILALQLLWFMIQVVARGSRGLTVTLIELDTVCVAVLSLLILGFWWHKPLRPNCPHVFYSHQEVNADPKMQLLSKAWKEEPGYVELLMSYLTDTRATPTTTNDEETTLVGEDKPPLPKCNMMDKIGAHESNAVISCGAWMVLGALHLVAWNFIFLTEAEKMLWRTASLVSAASPLAYLTVWAIHHELNLKRCNWAKHANRVYVALLCTINGVSRVLLVALMLASLRSLPCTAYQTVSWTTFIPHL